MTKTFLSPDFGCRPVAASVSFPGPPPCPSVAQRGFESAPARRQRICALCLSCERCHADAKAVCDLCRQCQRCHPSEV